MNAVALGVLIIKCDVTYVNLKRFN